MEDQINYLNRKETGYYFLVKINSLSKNTLFLASNYHSEFSDNPKKEDYIIKSYSYSNAFEKLNVDEEIKIMYLLKDFDCFIHFKDYFDLVYQNKKHLFLVMKYYPYSDLYNLVYSNNYFNKLNMKTFGLIAYQLLQILLILKNEGIVHHDIKLENILISSKCPLKILLTDFECSEVISTNQKAYRYVGTSYMMAPEVLMRQPHDFSADMWNVGFILFQLLYGYNPYNIDDQCQSSEELIEMMKFNDLFDDSFGFDNVPKDVKELISNMLKINPSERITVENALKSRWIINILNEGVN